MRELKIDREKVDDKVENKEEKIAEKVESKVVEQIGRSITGPEAYSLVLKAMSEYVKIEKQRYREDIERMRKVREDFKKALRGQFK